MAAQIVRLALVVAALLGVARALTLTSAAPVAPELSGKADRLPLPLEERLPLLMASQLLPKEPAAPASRAPVATSATQPVTTPLAQLEVNSELVIDRKPGRAPRAHDICRGRGRYYTHGGRSWRCNRYTHAAPRATLASWLAA